MRIERIDALRGFAVFGIVLVNIWSFVYGATGLRYGVGSEAASAGDRLAVFFTAAFAEQKFYPIFAFLFGAGFALSARGRSVAAFRAMFRRRRRWLLVCGLLHGSLLYMGDILSTYAIGAFWLMGKAGQRVRHLLASLRRLIVVNVVLLGLQAVLYFLLPPLSDMVADTLSATQVYTRGSWAEIALLRLSDFSANLFSAILFMPWIVLLFLLGVLAVRMGPLVRPQRYRRFWLTVLAAGLLALPFNLRAGHDAMRMMVDPDDVPAAAQLFAFLMNLAGPLLGAGYVAVFMLVRASWVAWLAPVGRMALSNYLMQSLLLMLLLQGTGLGLGAILPRAALPLVCVSIMGMQLLASYGWLERYRMGPMEALWRRYAQAAPMVK